MQIWFPEPNTSDDSPRRRDESRVDYLARATNYRAREMRRFLNENIAKWPENTQGDICAALHDLKRHESAFFELMVGRTLQALGAMIEVEKELESGRRPDFHAHFPDDTIIVEAVSPKFGAPWSEEFKNRDPLTDIVERHVPDGWSVEITQLPTIGPNDSKREFKTKVKEIMAALPPSAPGVELTVQEELPTGQIRFRFIPSRAGCSPIMAEFSAAHFSNFDQILEQKLRKKRNQVKQRIDESLPALLAVEYASDDELEDFDSALYGRTTESFDSSLQVVSRFRHGGLFDGNTEDVPTFAGILAYRVGYSSYYGPVLYRHPRFTGQFPTALTNLERRQCVDGWNIHCQPASENWSKELSKSLRLVQEE